MCIQEAYLAFRPELTERLPLQREAMMRELTRELVEDLEVWTEEAHRLSQLSWWESDTALGKVAGLVRDGWLLSKRLEQKQYMATGKYLASQSGKVGIEIDRYTAGYARTALEAVGLLRRGVRIVRNGKTARTWDVQLVFPGEVDVLSRLASMGVDPEKWGTWRKASKGYRARSADRKQRRNMRCEDAVYGPFTQANREPKGSHGRQR